MPLKIALIQVTDLDKFYDVIYQFSGLGDGGETPRLEKGRFVDEMEKKELPISAPYPIGVLAVAAYAREKFGDKIEISVIDMLQQRLHVDNLIERLEKYSPDVVGLSSFSSFSQALHKIAERVKSIDPKCKVVAGGAYCTASTKRAAGDKNIDCVVYGEGEETFVDIINKVLAKKDLGGVSGTARLENGDVVVNLPRKMIEDIDALPFPAVDLIDMKGYWGNFSALAHAGPWMILFNSRGCPYRCIYCHNIFGKKSRFMSVERTFNEVMFYNKNYGITEFHVWDDIFNLDVDRGVELSRRIASAGLDSKFLFMGGLRADIMKKGLLDEMVKAGACYICYAIESASPRIQKLARKNLDLKKAAETINYTADAGVWVNTYNMLGFPTETRDEMEMTVNFNVMQRHHSIRLFKVIPQEGTKLYDMMEPTRKTSDGETDMYFEYDDTVGKDVSKEDFKALINDGRRRFYLDPERLKRVASMKSPVLTDKEIMKIYSAELINVFLTLGIKEADDVPAEIRPLIGKIIVEGGLLTK